MVTNKNLYDAILETRESLHAKIDEVVNDRIVPMEKWQERMKGQLVIVGFFFVTVVTLLVEWIRSKLFKA